MRRNISMRLRAEKMGWLVVLKDEGKGTGQ